jgi:hypothetical protein
VKVRRRVAGPAEPQGYGSGFLAGGEQMAQALRSPVLAVDHRSIPGSDGQALEASRRRAAQPVQARSLHQSLRKERTSMKPSSSASRPLQPLPESAARAPHLLDTTMFWSAAGGGVGRYLRDKRRWLRAHTHWRHTLVVAGKGGDAQVRGLPLPFSGGYRFPLERRRAARQIASLAPDLIEAGDPYRLAWAALDAAQQRGIPVVAYCHSNVMEVAARWAGSTARAAAGRYARHVYRNFDAVFAGSRWIVGELRDLGLDNVVHQPLGVDLSAFSPARRDSAWRRRHAIPENTVVLVYAGRFAAEKNMHVLGELAERLGAGFLLVAIGAGRSRAARVRNSAWGPDRARSSAHDSDVLSTPANRRPSGWLRSSWSAVRRWSCLRAGCARSSTAIGVGVTGGPAALSEGVLAPLEGDRDRRRRAAAQRARVRRESRIPPPRRALRGAISISAAPRRSPALCMTPNGCACRCTTLRRRHGAHVSA